METAAQFVRQMRGCAASSFLPCRNREVDERVVRDGREGVEKA
jgi:hypothetical protein